MTLGENESIERPKERAVVAPDAWRLFYSLFKEGDKIIVVLGSDGFLWGTLNRVEAEGCWIRGETRKRGYAPVPSSYFIYWDEIRFMAHDGFPVKKLMGADGSKSIEKLTTSNIQESIAEALWVPNRESSEEKAQKSTTDWYANSNAASDTESGGISGHDLVFGDPFLIENASLILLNKGNSGPNFYDALYEEVIVCKSKDGVMGLLYDLRSIYYFAPVIRKSRGL